MKKSKNLVKVSVVTVVLIALVAAGAWYGLKYRTERSNLAKNYASALAQIETYKQDPNAAAKAQADKTITNVDKLYSLPKDETPSVASVSDKGKLKSQPFFVNAENGDVTLIYSKAKLAILYRPSTDKIINVSSVTIQDTKPTTPTTTTP